MDHSECLIRFIKAFIPPSKRIAKGTHTSGDYITKTINRIFNRYLDIPVSFEQTDVYETFKDLGYKHIKDEFVMSSSGLEGSGHLVWIGVNSSDIKRLYLTLTTLPSNTNESKRGEVKELVSSLNEFKKSISQA